MKQTIIFAFLLFSLSGLLFPPVTFAQYQSDTVMPDWFKNNAKWWKDGLITDSDIINALESLIIQDVIPLDNFVKASSGLDHTAGVSPGGTFVNVYDEPKIPSYQKDVFGFWSDGQVPDSEIVNSIGYLMSEGIISSEKINKEITDRKEKYTQSFSTSDLEDRTSKESGINSRTSATVCDSDSVCDSDKGETCSARTGESGWECVPTWFGIMHAWAPEAYVEIFETAKQNEVSMTYLQKIKAAEYNIIKNAYDQSLNDYSNNKNPDSMNRMVSLGNAEKIAKKESERAVEIQKTAKQLAENAKDKSVKSGLHVLDLEKVVMNQQSEIDSINNIKTESEIKSAYKDAQKSQRLANINLQKSLSSVISDTNQFQQLSFSDQNSLLDVFNTIDYSNISNVTPCEDSSSFGSSAKFLLGLQIPFAFGDEIPCEPERSSVPVYEGLEYVHSFIIYLFTDSKEMVRNTGSDDQHRSEKWKLYMDDWAIKQNQNYSKSIPIPEEDVATLIDKGGNFFVFLNSESKEGEGLFDSNNSVESNEWGIEDSFFTGVTLPNGRTVTIAQEIKQGTLDSIINAETIKGNDMIQESGSKIIIPDTSSSDTSSMGPASSVQIGETEDGRKIWLHTGFNGNTWTTTDPPSSDTSSSDTSSSDTSCDDCIWTTSVQFIDNKAYPMFQFMGFPGGYPNCPNGPDGTSGAVGPNVMASKDYLTVYHLDFDGIGLTWDEDANGGCGNFGKLGDADKLHPITESQGNFMKEKFNFDFQFESYVPSPETESLDVSDNSNDSTDTDGDGIVDSIDTKPNEVSDEFVDEESSVRGKILDNAGHTIKITKKDGSVRIEVGTEGGSDPAIIEILDVETELEPGTIIDARFG